MRYKVLYRLSNDSFLHYKNFSFYVDNLKVGSFDASIIKRFICRFRIIERLLRAEPRAVGRISDYKFIISANHKIFILDIKDHNITELLQSRDGWSDPLNFCSDGRYVYWGEYGNNPTHNSVRIYRVDHALRVNVVYEFKAGSIRHIHNIIWDKHHSCFYIFTGDLETTSGIYKASNDWSKVTPIYTGNQQYRAVVGFSTEDGLIYVTDSVETMNNIYLIVNNELKILSSFPGSCIYGCETKTHYVFSSTVEPPEGRGGVSLFSYKLGNGIVDRCAHLITVRKKDFFVTDLIQYHKDCLPMKLFQYGAIMLPQGQKNCTDLVYYIMACQGDGMSKIIKIQ